MARGDGRSPQVAIGFEAHAPLPLAERNVLPDTGTDASSLFLSHPFTLRQLRARATDCYVPVAEFLLGALDEGFSCSLAVPGILGSLLSENEADAFDALRELARHPRCELLGRTYYQSIAGLFQDSSEFRAQIDLHQKTMQDLFGTRPRVYFATSFISGPPLIERLGKMGFSGVYLKGYERTLNNCSPNELLTCRGVPVLLQNCRLTDDIVIRGGKVEWDQYPLTPEKFAGWIPLCKGSCIHIIPDLEALRETNGRENRLFEFFRKLPAALAREGVRTVLPGEVLAMSPVGELPVSYFPNAAEGEINSSILSRTILQHSAFEAVERAQPWLHDSVLWGCFQISDHFRLMATRSGECGSPLHQTEHQNAYDYFASYMTALSRCEEAGISRIRARSAARALRTLPPEKAFHFHDAFRYTGISAYNLDEFLEMLRYVSPDVIAFHAARNDFSTWIRETIQDPLLARETEGCSTREELIRVVERRVTRLWKNLK